MQSASQNIAPKGELTLRTLAMPRDVNTNGDIFGGWVLSQMDMAAGIVASARAQGRVATVAMANKTARIAWAVLARSETYRAQAMA